MLSANIKKLCAEREISVFALENATGVANGSVSRWDKKPPKIYNLKRVATSSGCRWTPCWRVWMIPGSAPSPELPRVKHTTPRRDYPCRTTA